MDYAGGMHPGHLHAGGGCACHDPAGRGKPGVYTQHPCGQYAADYAAADPAYRTCAAFGAGEDPIPCGSDPSAQPISEPCPSDAGTQYLYQKGDIDKSIQYYQKVYEADPNIPLIHLHLAMVYLAKKDMVHFNEHYQKVSQKDLNDYLKEIGVSYEDILVSDKNSKHIAPEDLVKEFLNNKDNSN